MDSSIVLILTPADKYGRAADAFRLPHNQNCYIPPIVPDNGFSRENTPADWTENRPFENLEDFHRIVLTSDQKVKVPGFVTFGTDPKHFRITFDRDHRAVVQDVSTNGTAVSYDGQAEEERRNHFQWILFEQFKQIHIEVQRDGLAFNLHLPRHGSSSKKREYEQNVDRFMAAAQSDFYAMATMRLDDPSVPSSAVLASNQAPIYLDLLEVGCGAFGRVCKVIEASTGDVYAGKEFFRQEGWKGEVDIMRRVHHDHIVKFIDFRPEPKPLLVMEYLPLGNMEEEDKASPITAEEMIVLMIQVLSALAYVHKIEITHRDLKPANILVCSRRPFVVKLSDFGLAQDKAMLQTFCGTGLYLAPEVFTSSSYTNAVDIWALAIIILQYVYGLPQQDQPQKRKRQVKAKDALQEWGLNWCRRLMTTAEDWDSDPLIDFLRTYMLRLEPHERLPAEDCLVKASELDLSNGAYSEKGHSTPKAHIAEANDDDQADRSTIILSHLWGDDSRNVPARREGSTFLLSTMQAASAIEGDPMLVRSSTSQTECKRKARLYTEANTMSVRGPQATESNHHRRTSMRDGYPSLPSLRSDSIDISSGVEWLLGNETTTRAVRERAHPQPNSKHGKRRMISSERSNAGASGTLHAPSFTILHCGNQKVFLDVNHNVNANHVLHAGGMNKKEVARLRAAEQFTVIRFVKGNPRAQGMASTQRISAKSNDILEICKQTSGTKIIPLKSFW